MPLPTSEAAFEGLTDSAAPLKLTGAEFAKISQFAHEHFGLELKAGKEELVAARLAKVVRRGRFGSYGEYFSSALSDRTGQALTELINALTTNHTSFVREPAHFELLESVAKGEFSKVPVIRVWSAACSTGEEPYTIACCLTAAAKRDPRTWEIRATDISTRVLDRARQGLYQAATLEPLPQDWLRAGFQRGHGNSEGWYRARPEIAARIKFEHINLIEPGSGSGGWHVIFCRNVMIYFDKPTQERVVQRLASSLEPGGYLLVGHSESLAGITHGLAYVQPATYRKGRDGSNERRTRC